MSKFYIYFYLRADGSPYYIGKGSGNRCYQPHLGFNPPADRNRIIKIYQNLDEQTCFAMERFWISVYGRKDIGTGILRNKSDGGGQPPTNYGDKNAMKNPTLKAKQVASRKANGNYTRTAIQNEKCSINHKSKGICPPSQKGRVATEEYKIKMKQSLTESWATGARRQSQIKKKEQLVMLTNQVEV